jgi:lipopolysaccharide transport system permease protein
VFTMGLGMLLACVNVFYRDVQHLVQVALQFGFWLTPIVYVTSALPDRVVSVLHWNPMFALIRAVQDIFLEQAQPDWLSLLYPGGVGLVFAVLGILAFHRLQGEIVDAL